MTEPGSGLGRGKGRSPFYDRDFIYEAWALYGSVRDAAEATGASVSTVYKALRKKGVKLKGRGGRPRPGFCRQGHDQQVWRREDRNGRGFCGKCKSLRDAEYQRRRKH